LLLDNKAQKMALTVAQHKKKTHTHTHTHRIGN